LITSEQTNFEIKYLHTSQILQISKVQQDYLNQWSSTWGTRRHTGYVKLKNKCYFVINTKESGPDLGLATGDPGHQQILGYKVEGKLHVGVREKKKRLNTPDLNNHKRNNTSPTRARTRA
jgi:hypothetical protein